MEKGEASVATSKTETTLFANDLKKDNIESSENDFDLEPAESSRCENLDSTETLAPHSEQ